MLCAYFSASILLYLKIVTVNGNCCPDGWLTYSTSCYSVITSQTNWAGASNACTTLGAHLANVETAEENAFLAGFLKDFASVGADLSAWIGGTDMVIEGTWNWEPSGERLEYTDWGPGEPNSQEGDEDCLIYHPYDSHTFHWVDTPCKSVHTFICEKPIATDPVIG